MSGIGLPELIIFALEVLVIVAIVWGAYRLIRLAVRRELDRREMEPRDRDPQ
jgi:hypothetical protein